MGDTLPVVRTAVAQAVPPFLDRDAGIERACELIRAAGAESAQVVVLPEGFIPTHPIWYHFHAATSQAAIDMAADLFRNSVVVGGPHTDPLVDAARDSGCHAVVGICEKEHGTTGTMWNTTLHIDPVHGIVGRRRKLTPTVGERLVHAHGHGDGLRAVPTDYGPVTSLLCAENSNPLAVFSVTAQSSVLHAALWPNHFSPTQPIMRDVIVGASKALAYRAGAYVLSAASTLDDATRKRVANTDEDLAWVSDPANLGGSCIVAPDGRVLAGPLGDEEGLLVADCNLDALVPKKVIHDYAGHYNREDVFRLLVRDAPGAILDAPWDREPAAGGTVAAVSDEVIEPGSSGGTDR
jgi:nitrilase